MRNFYNPQPCFEIKQNFDNFNFNEHYIQNPNCSCPPKIMPSPHNNCFEYTTPGWRCLLSFEWMGPILKEKY